MPQPNGKLILDLVDVYGKPLKGQASIKLKHYRLSDQQSAMWTPENPPLEISGLHRVPHGQYWIEVRPLGYCSTSHTVSIKASGDTHLQICCPIDPGEVTTVKFPKYDKLPPQVKDLLSGSSNVSGFIGMSGGDLYDALEEERRAGLLNILEKSDKTKLVDGSSVLSYIEELRSLRRDRFFAKVKNDLDDAVWASSAVFTKESGALHNLPPKLKQESFKRTDSYKTKDKYGNLQLTFFSNDTDTIADIDIDDAKGFEHGFQVAGHWLTGRKTHPYAIHQILVHHQGLDPGYTLQV